MKILSILWFMIDIKTFIVKKEVIYPSLSYRVVVSRILIVCSSFLPVLSLFVFLYFYAHL